MGNYAYLDVYHIYTATTEGFEKYVLSEINLVTLTGTFFSMVVVWTHLKSSSCNSL